MTVSNARDWGGFAQFAAKMMKGYDEGSRENHDRRVADALTKAKLSDINRQRAEMEARQADDDYSAAQKMMADAQSNPNADISAAAQAHDEALRRREEARSRLAASYQQVDIPEYKSPGILEPFQAAGRGIASGAKAIAGGAGSLFSGLSPRVKFQPWNPQSPENQELGRNFRQLDENMAFNATGQVPQPGQFRQSGQAMPTEQPQAMQQESPQAKQARASQTSLIETQQRKQSYGGYSAERANLVDAISKLPRVASTQEEADRLSKRYASLYNRLSDLEGKMSEVGPIQGQASHYSELEAIENPEEYAASIGGAVSESSKKKSNESATSALNVIKGIHDDLDKWLSSPAGTAFTPMQGLLLLNHAYNQLSDEDDKMAVTAARDRLVERMQQMGIEPAGTVLSSGMAEEKQATWQLRQMPDGSMVLFNPLTQEIKPAMGSQQESATPVLRNIDGQTYERSGDQWVRPNVEAAPIQQAQRPDQPEIDAAYDRLVSQYRDKTIEQAIAGVSKLANGQYETRERAAAQRLLGELQSIMQQTGGSQQQQQPTQSSRSTRQVSETDVRTVMDNAAKAGKNAKEIQVILSALAKDHPEVAGYISTMTRGWNR